MFRSGAAYRRIVCHFPCGSVDWNFLSCRVLLIAPWSLPLRKCGLKFQASDYARKWPSSLPLRKCGLKLHHDLPFRLPPRHFPCGSVDWNNEDGSPMIDEKTSLPLRKCGLKLPYCRLRIGWSAVTSLAEVWIEIPKLVWYCFNNTVTSLAEVWIEIATSWRSAHRKLVTSLAEVWIEILMNLQVH